MAEENTITTIFKADISQFSASTQQLNSYIKTVNSEFGVATASMGKWSDSTDGLQAKITQLNKTLDAEKMKLGNLEKALSDLQREGKGNTKQAQNLQIAINNQKATIAKTEKQVGDYETALKELEKAGVNTRQELDKLNKTAKENGETSSNVAGSIMKGLGGAVAGIATMATGAVSGFLALGESTREFRKEQAQLETAFVTAGHSAETANKMYAEFNAVLGDTSKTTEAMQQLAQFTKSEEELADYTNILTGVFATYGEALSTEGLAEGINHTIKLGEVQGTLADALEWGGVSVEEFNDQLAKCNTEEERNALISKKLNELYGEQAEHYKENNKDIIEAEKAQTRLTQSMADLGAVAEPIMTMLKNALSDLLEAIMPFVELMGKGLASAFNGSAEGAKQFAEGLTGIVNVLLTKITDMLPNVINMVLQLIPTLYEAFLKAIPQLITTIGTIVTQVANALKELLPTLVQAIIDVLPLLIEALMNTLPQIMLAIVDMVTAIVEALPTLIDNLLNALPTIINTIINALMEYYPNLAEASIKLFMALVEAIPTIIQSLVEVLPTIINAVIDGLLGMLPVLLECSITLFMALVEAIPTIIKVLVVEIPKISRTITTTLLSKLPDIIKCAIELFMGIIEAIPKICIELVKELPTIISTIVEGLIDGIPDLIEAGKDLLSGLFKGLIDTDAIGKKIKSLGDKIVGGVKKFFGINSPSKLFENEIGKNLVLGIGRGFDDDVSKVTKSMTKSFNKAMPTLQIDTPAMAVVGGYSETMQSQNLVAQLSDLLSRERNVVNNYNVSNTFEKMETSQLALHKANLELKRIIGG